jgi:hypothetical protein
MFMLPEPVLLVSRPVTVAPRPTPVKRASNPAAMTPWAPDPNWDAANALDVLAMASR